MANRKWILFAAQYLGGSFGDGVAVICGGQCGRQSVSSGRPLEWLLEEYAEQIVEGAVVVDGRGSELNLAPPGIEIQKGMDYRGTSDGWCVTGPYDRARWDIANKHRVGLWHDGVVHWADEAVAQLSDDELWHVIESSHTEAGQVRFPADWLRLAALARLDDKGALTESVAARILAGASNVWLARAVAARGYGARIAAEVFRREPDPVVRWALVKAHGDRNPKLAAMAAIDKEMKVAWAGVQAAANACNLDLLLEVAKDHANEFIRAAAIGNLGRLGGSEDVLLDIALKDASRHVRSHAVRELRDVASLDAVAAVEQDWWVQDRVRDQKAVVEALGLSSEAPAFAGPGMHA